MQAEPTDIVRELRIAASPETIFEFFVDPQMIVRWKGRLASLDPRPGGEFLVDFNGEDVATGEYVEVDPPRRVVFTWGWKAPGHPIPPGTSRVEVTLTPEGDGTLVRFVHLGSPGARRRGARGGMGSLPAPAAGRRGRRRPGARPPGLSPAEEERTMGNPVVHFEVYGRNAAQMNEFYSKAFGWDIHADNPMNYGMVHTNAEGKGIEGGTAEGDPRVNVVIEVPDLEAALSHIESLGGKTVTPVTEIPGVVTFAEFADPEGNVLGLSKSE